jgi:hypothetical protein
MVIEKRENLLKPCYVIDRLAVADEKETHRGRVVGWSLQMCEG